MHVFRAAAAGALADGEAEQNLIVQGTPALFQVYSPDGGKALRHLRTPSSDVEDKLVFVAAGASGGDLSAYADGAYFTANADGSISPADWPEKVIGVDAT